MRQVSSRRGSVSAEFAIAVPAVLMVLGLAIGAIMLTTHRLTLTSAAAEIARLEARGDSAAAATRVSMLHASATVTRENSAGILCVTVTDNPGSGLLSFVEVGARGCAAISEDGTS